MKKLLLLMLVMTMAAAVLTGCTSEAESTDNVGSSETVSDESESEVISEEVSEEVSETESVDGSEEISEEVIVDYSAETIMALCDELSQKYPIENPEHIKATMIIANLDNISAEDLEVLFSTYGYDYEKIEELFIEYLSVLHDSSKATFEVEQGAMEDYIKEKADFADRMPIYEVVLNPADMEYATYCYERVGQHIYGERTFMGDIELYEEEINGGTYTYADDAVTNYICCCMVGIDSYSSPYETFGLDITATK